MRKRWILFMVGFALMSHDAEAAKPNVVATFSILGDIVKNIADDHVALVVLVGSNGDAHEFEPTPQDVVTLNKADMIVENGLHFEPWLDKIYEASGSDAKRVVASTGITIRHRDDSKVEIDPHAWHDVSNVVVYAQNISVALQAIDPSNAEIYATNAANYILQLEELDRKINDDLSKLQNRNIVTNHDALGYFAARYGFQIIGSLIPAGTTEAADPSAKQTAALADAIKAHGVKVIFIENMANSKLATVLSKEVGVQIGPDLYTDALGNNNSDGADYIRMMRHNVEMFLKYLSS